MNRLYGWLLAGLLVVAVMVAGGLVNPSGIHVSSADPLNANAVPITANLAADDSTSAENLRTISVSSTVEVSAEPTKAELWFSVETLAPTAQVSQQQNASLTQKVIAALAGMGITGKNVETSSYSLYQKTEWDSRTQENVDRGFQTVNSIKVTVNDLSKTGQVIDQAVQAGANRVTSIAFTVDDAKQAELKRTGLIKASQEAKVKAQAIASGLGIELDGVQSVSENSSYYVPYNRSFDLAQSAGSMAAPETPISPGDVKVSANINVVFKIK
ncbi:MAG: SIMPL domain-containing protein [Candidatus Micrarchaeota archaeon]